MIAWWVRLWDRREVPAVLALLRLLIGGLLVWDLGLALWLDLVPTLWAPPEAGGLPSKLLQREVIPEVYRWFAPTAATARGLHALVLGAAALFGAGLFTRLSGVVLLLGYAQLALVLPLGDRGIDLMMRNVIAILLFSACGRTLSVDARLRTGSWWGDGALAPAWPRHLIVLQLVVMYWMAGVQKTALAWTPLGGYHALTIILQDPHIARYDFGWLMDWPLLGSVATATTHLFEWTAPLVLLAYHYRDTAERPGALRAFFNRWRVHQLWVAVGVLLHVGIALTMNLGIFPYAMLALYPAWFHPDELQGAGAWLRARLSPAGSTA